MNFFVYARGILVLFSQKWITIKYIFNSIAGRPKDMAISKSYFFIASSLPTLPTGRRGRQASLLRLEKDNGGF